MMNNRGRKWMALLLAAVMLLGILPISAMAADEENPVEADTEFTGEVLEATELTAEKGFAISAKYKNKDGKEVADLSQEDPNNTFSLSLKVENIDQTALGAAGEEVQMSYQLENVTAVAGENDIVSWTYDETSGILVFQWKQGKKSGSFSADISVTPAFPAENDLSGSYAMVSGSNVMLLDTKLKKDARARMTGVAVMVVGNKIMPSTEQKTLWTFTHVSGDWYTISSNGKYLKLTPSNNGGGLETTNDPETAQKIKVEKVDQNHFRFYANNYRITNSGGKPDLGFAGYLGTGANETFTLYSSDQIITGTLVIFNVNGGNAAMDSAFIEAQPGESIVLPDYSGTKGGARFIGWAKVSNIYVNIPGTNHCYYDVFLPGSEITVDGSMTLYAVYNEKGINARFGIRLDGTIPDEPGNYSDTGYGGHVTIDNAIIDGKWIVDTNGNKPIEGNHLANNVAANFTKLPSDEQIRTALKKEGGLDYDPETMYVHWYVMKYSGGKWKIDGVLRLREKRSISYNTNVEDRQDNTSVANMPLGYETTRSSIVTVGAGQDGSIKTPVREGYIFTGWNSEPDGSGTAFITGSTIQLTGNVNLYAQWTKENVRSITITSDWPDGKQGYRGARITMTATLYGFEDVTSYTLQWQYSTDGETWHDVANAHGITYTYELDETTRYNTWRVIAVDIR